MAHVPRRLVRAAARCLAAALVVLAASAAPEAPASAAGIVVLSFNLRYDNPADGANAWPLRKDMTAGTILFHKADVIGMQEALRGQIADLEARLPGYGWFGVGRDDGRDAGEFNPIFYDKARLKLLDHAVFWLSETPGAAGSRGWDAACNRIVTWGRFEDAATGRTFFVFNTHLDHKGPTARREGAALLRRKAAEIAGGGPAVVTGDFNCTAADEPYRILTSAESSAPALRDARDVSALKPYGGVRSFNGFKPAEGPGEIIDHIFVRGGVGVARAGVIADLWDGRFVSDHYPVLAEILLPASPGKER